jgi:type 1 glutamine amidotransferase
MTRVFIVSGSGPYSDPWHPFDETSARLAEILASRYEVTVTTEVAAALADLDPDRWDLVVLNFGSAGLEVPTDGASVDGIERYLDGGGALLVSHVTATAFPEEPRWEQILGGRWVRGTTMHPPHGDAEIEVTPVDHAVTRDLPSFVLSDERYSYLRVSGSIDVLATHRHDDQDHAVVWAGRRPARVFYDGLGHDGRSYDSAEHRALVLNAASWLLGEERPGGPSAS